MNKRRVTRRERRERRRLRIRATVSGTAKRPRLSVYRSLKSMYVQIIDDQKGKTLVALNSKTAGAAGNAGERTGRTAQAYLLGKLLAEKAKILKVEKIVFDRAGYKYHGRVKALAEGARDGGLQF